MKPTAPFLTNTMIKYHLWQLCKAEKRAAGEQTELLDPLSSSNATANAGYLYVDASTISTLINNNEESEEDTIQEEPSTAPSGNNALVSDRRTTTGSASITDITGTRTCEDVVAGNVTQYVSEEDASHRNDVVGVFGRQKGSTQAHSRELKERFEASNRMGRRGIR
jgi:hypothetical protein